MTLAKPVCMCEHEECCDRLRALVHDALYRRICPEAYRDTYEHMLEYKRTIACEVILVWLGGHCSPIDSSGVANDV